MGVTGDNSVNEAAPSWRSGFEPGGGANATSETAVGNINITTGGDTLATLIVGGVNVTAGGTVDRRPTAR